MSAAMNLFSALTALYAALGSFFGAPTTHRLNFFIRDTAVTRLCKTKTILTVNDQYPGPTIYACKGDRVVVNVVNNGHKNITIHWHGVAQRRNPWHDGPAYVTQCPIVPGSSFTYDVQLTDEEGTLWWHAHTDYDRWTVHGAFVIRPRRRWGRSTLGGVTVPQPVDDIPIILGEWFNADVERIYADAVPRGGGVTSSDTNTINGQPGDLALCSKNETFKMTVERGKTYLLRLINAAMENPFFFAVTGHPLTVVATDAAYVKPFTVDYLVIHQGQTMDVLLTANEPVGNASSASGQYYMAARPFQYFVGPDLDLTTATGIVEYPPLAGRKGIPVPGSPEIPFLPRVDDIQTASDLRSKFRALADADHPVNVPEEVDEHILMTVSANVMPCPPGMRCMGPDGVRLAFSFNNVTLELPSISVLQAYHDNISGVYTTDFPRNPPFPFNYTAAEQPDELLLPTQAMEALVLDYNVSVEIVLQGTTLFGGNGNHPVHIHGHSFYVVGSGVGNFDKEKDPLKYNLIDPPYVNTVAVGTDGWVAIRFRAANPGVWFMHCHMARHLAWGLGVVLIVKDGDRPEDRMLPPPAGMPPC